MQHPIQVDLPHKLGRDEARRRIANNIHKLKEHIPGGASHVDSTWAGDDLNLAIHALGQAVDAKIGVEETKVRVQVMLPGMLAMFAAPIEAMLQKKGNILLEDKRD
jgi:putative polyhydroxyalkanoate system protein